MGKRNHEESHLHCSTTQPAAPKPHQSSPCSQPLATCLDFVRLNGKLAPSSPTACTGSPERKRPCMQSWERRLLLFCTEHVRLGQRGLDKLWLFRSGDVADVFPKRNKVGQLHQGQLTVFAANDKVWTYIKIRIWRTCICHISLTASQNFQDFFEKIQTDTNQCDF